MIKPVKELPPGYTPAGGVSIRKVSDITQMLVWSIVLPIICILVIFLILRPNLSTGDFEFTTGGMFVF